jgi:large subunit ribosomal protein L22
MRPTTHGPSPKWEVKPVEAKAIVKYVRLSPRKVRQVVDLIRGKKVNEALAILRYVPKRASEVVTKAVKSAAANAENNMQMERDELFVTSCFVDQGPTLKRFQPRAMGRADVIRKRTSHITVMVGDKKEG